MLRSKYYLLGKYVTGFEKDRISGERYMKMLHTVKKTKIEKFFRTKALQSDLKETSVFLKNVSPKVSESHSINPNLGG